MNKKISTLLAGIALMGAVSANAQQVEKGYYYHLQTQEVGTTTTAKLNLVLTKDNAAKKDSVIAIVSTEEAALQDSALWKIDYAIDQVTGKYTYTFTNKAVPTAQLSFGTNSNMKGDNATNKIDGADASAFGLNEKTSLSGALKFAWGTPTSVLAGAVTPMSYIQAKDSTLTLAVKLDGTAAVSGTKYPLIVVMRKGNEPTVTPDADALNPTIQLQAVAPAKRLLTVKELNDKLGEGKGFQLFFFHKNVLTNENNALAGVIFEAESGTNGVLLKAKTLAPKTSKADVQKALYAYIDTISYSAATNQPTNGSRMTFKVDTLPTTDGAALVAGNGVLTAAAYTFNFVVDPSNPKDSVAVFVNGSYNPTTGTAPKTWQDKTPATNAVFPLQIDALGGTTSDKTILTTAAEVVVFNTYPTLASTAPALDKDTRIAFTGGDLINPLFDATKVYSVKYVNEAASYDADKKGKYLVVAPTSATAYGEAYSNSVFDHLPSTQFVFDGAKMINREMATVTTNALYSVEGKTDVYTNLTDTFEIKAMANVNVKDSTMGWAYISADSLTNYAFSLDYISGILEGRSINVKADSTVVATTEEGKLFKLEAVDFGKVSDAAEIDDVKTLYNQAYKIYSKDKNFFIVKDGNKLALTSKTSGATPASFYLKETESKGEYILVEGTNKYNVNSTNESLETVGLNLSNNAFAVQVEKAPEYVLDAKGHYNIENLRGDMLAADANGFGMFRKEGELKATYSKDDFALWIDTAKIHPTKPSYFILSGAKVGEGSELEGNFLRVMSDSASVEGYKAGNGWTRLAFVPAKREATSDSLLVNYQNETLVKADSVDYKGKNTGKIAQFRFFIQYTENEGEYIIENEAGYLATYNDVLCLLTKADAATQEAQLVKLTKASAPTANEGVEVSEVKVIADEGQVTITNAAGKKVVISNILGQVVANTVIASDNATIAAPAGVVVVAVEGEEAVKAIVK